MKKRVTLGVAAGKLLAFARAESEAYEDLRAFGAPSECRELVHRGNLREANELANELARETGLQARALAAEFQRRCCHKWLYVNNVLCALDMALEYRHLRRHRHAA